MTSEEVCDGRRDIDVLHQGIRHECLTFGKERWVPDGKRYPDRLLVRHSLLPPTVFAVQEAVVRQVEHQGVLLTRPQAVQKEPHRAIQTLDGLSHDLVLLVDGGDLVTR